VAPSARGARDLFHHHHVRSTLSTAVLGTFSLFTLVSGRNTGNPAPGEVRRITLGVGRGRRRSNGGRRRELERRLAVSAPFPANTAAICVRERPALLVRVLSRPRSLSCDRPHASTLSTAPSTASRYSARPCTAMPAAASPLPRSAKASAAEVHAASPLPTRCSRRRCCAGLDVPPSPNGRRPRLVAAARGLPCDRAPEVGCLAPRVSPCACARYACPSATSHAAALELGATGPGLPTPSPCARPLDHAASALAAAALGPRASVPRTQRLSGARFPKSCRIQEATV
jgi:hypothetical protein